MSAHVLTISDNDSARTVADLFSVLLPDARTVLDATYGSGKFWGKAKDLNVTGLDADPARARHVCGNFRALPFAADSFDVVVFDPPYQTNMGRGKPSVMGSRFGTFANVVDLQDAVRDGCSEAWRVARVGVVVKVQSHIHNQRLVHMERWVEDAIPAPLYDQMHVRRASKMVDPKWTDQLSIWRNHSTYMVFRHGDQRHIRRAPSPADVGAG